MGVIKDAKQILWSPGPSWLAARIKIQQKQLFCEDSNAQI